MQNLITKLAIATVGVTFLSQGVISAPAMAETYLFDNAEYDLTLNVTPSSIPGILYTFLAGDSINAPFGLTHFQSNTYTQIDFTTGQITFNTDPATFNLQSSQGFIKFSGTGSDSNNEISGDAKGNGFTNLVTGDQTWNAFATITDGEGIFSGAVGQLNFSFSGTALPNQAESFRGRFLVSGSLSTPTATVPESSPVAALLGIGAIGFGVLVRRGGYKSTIA